jgi:dsDNA-specific endonuclease/ATPase MutS2
MEPKPAIQLNNNVQKLHGEEQAEEQRILSNVCAHVVAALSAIDDALAGVQGLDLASARARHARWAARYFGIQCSQARWIHV